MAMSRCPYGDYGVSTESHGVLLRSLGVPVGDRLRVHGALTARSRRAHGVLGAATARERRARGVQSALTASFKEEPKWNFVRLCMCYYYISLHNNREIYVQNASTS